MSSLFILDLYFYFIHWEGSSETMRTLIVCYYYFITHYRCSANVSCALAETLTYKYLDQSNDANLKWTEFEDHYP